MKYKLKEEAKQFFSKELQNSKYSLGTWKDQNIHPNLLEEVTEPYTILEYGYTKYDSDIKDVAEFRSQSKISRHYFTVVTENADNKLHDTITKNKEELTKLLNETVQVFIKNNNLN